MTDQATRRVALIAGGAGGMGMAIAARLSAGGYAVVLADLPSERLTAAGRTLQAEGAEVLAVPLDIRKVSSCAAAVQEVVAWHGRLDVLVNAAGVWREGEAVTMTEDDWDIVLDVNLKGAFFLIQAAIPHLGAGASIVNIASDAGRVGSSQEAVYSACKGGIIAFTKTVARETARKGVTLNAVCPGPTDTPLLAEVAGESERGQKVRAALINAIPMKRVGQPEDIPGAVCFLASDDAGFITGQTISVSGGLTMHG